jgi:hypothetical protein
MKDFNERDGRSFNYIYMFGLKEKRGGKERDFNYIYIWFTKG